MRKRGAKSSAGSQEGAGVENVMAREGLSLMARRNHSNALGEYRALIFKPVLSSRGRQEPKPAGTKNKHFKFLNNPEISDLSTLVL